MADRFPLIIDNSAEKIKELVSGDNLDLTKSNLKNADYIQSAGVNVAGVATATSLIGDGSQLTNLPPSGGSLQATASGTLADGDTTIVNTDGTVSAVGESTENYWFSMLSQGSYDSARGGAVDSSGNLYVCGQSDSSGFVVKYNSSGTVQWKRSFSSSSTDYAKGLVLDSSGNVYITGYSNSGGQGGVETYIIKYNNSGTVQWSRYFGINGEDTGNAIAIDSSDNIYIVGTNIISGTGTREMSLAKFNSSGTLAWERELTSTGNNTYGVSLAVDSSDNPVITGYTNALGQGGTDIIIAKYNSSGTIQWQKSFGGSNNEEAKGMAIDSSDNIYVGGFTQSEGAGAQDALVAKFNSSGDLQWQRILGAYDTDSWGVSVDDDGNVYGLGHSSREPSNTGLVNQFIMAKYNSSGDLQWQRHFGGTAGEYVFGRTASGDGDLYLFGSTGTSVSNGVEDAITLKVPGDGTLTGTHGSFTYGTSTWTPATSNLTAATSTLTEQAGARISSDASSSFTFSSSTISDSLTSVGTGSKSNITSENYIGISDGAYTNGQTATVQIMGAVDDAQSSLTPGQSYYVQNDGTLSTSAGSPSVFAGTAIAATKLIVRG